LEESKMPKSWYNISADLPKPLSPVLHPGTLKPVGPDDLAPLFPMALIGQEVSQEREIEIPQPVREIYKQWRPSPLYRARKLEKEGKIKIKTPFQINSIEGQDKINAITIKNDKDKIETIATDCVLGFFGLIMKLGPIAEWGLNLEKKHIPVNTENFQTNKEGIFAIGDICTYPGKLKLILSGFHEGALAARACFKLARPNEKYRFEFTTTSKSMHERLGVKVK